MLMLVLFNGVNGADIRVVQSRSGASLPLKALERMRVLRQFCRQKLKCDPPPQLGVFRFVDNAHAAASQLAGDSVMRSCFRDERVHARGEMLLCNNRGATQA